MILSLDSNFFLILFRWCRYFSGHWSNRTNLSEEAYKPTETYTWKKFKTNLNIRDGKQTQALDSKFLTYIVLINLPFLAETMLIYLKSYHPIVSRLNSALVRGSYTRDLKDFVIKIKKRLVVRGILKWYCGPRMGSSLDGFGWVGAYPSSTYLVIMPNIHAQTSSACVFWEFIGLGWAHLTVSQGGWLNPSTTHKSFKWMCASNFQVHRHLQGCSIDHEMVVTEVLGRNVCLIYS